MNVCSSPVGSVVAFSAIAYVIVCIVVWAMCNYPAVAQRDNTETLPEEEKEEEPDEKPKKKRIHKKRKRRGHHMFDVV